MIDIILVYHYFVKTWLDTKYIQSYSGTDPALVKNSLLVRVCMTGLNWSIVHCYHSSCFLAYSHPKLWVHFTIHFQFFSGFMMNLAKFINSWDWELLWMMIRGSSVSLFVLYWAKHGQMAQMAANSGNIQILIAIFSYTLSDTKQFGIPALNGTNIFYFICSLLSVFEPQLLLYHVLIWKSNSAQWGTTLKFVFQHQNRQIFPKTTCRLFPANLQTLKCICICTGKD